MTEYTCPICKTVQTEGFRHSCFTPISIPSDIPSYDYKVLTDDYYDGLIRQMVTGYPGWEMFPGSMICGFEYRWDDGEQKPVPQYYCTIRKIKTGE